MTGQQPTHTRKYWRKIEPLTNYSSIVCFSASYQTEQKATTNTSCVGTITEKTAESTELAQVSLASASAAASRKATATPELLVSYLKLLQELRIPPRSDGRDLRVQRLRAHLKPHLMHRSNTIAPPPKKASSARSKRAGEHG